MLKTTNLTIKHPLKVSVDGGGGGGGAKGATESVHSFVTFNRWKDSLKLTIKIKLKMLYFIAGGINDRPSKYEQLDPVGHLHCKILLA